MLYKRMRAFGSLSVDYLAEDEESEESSICLVDFLYRCWLMVWKSS